jgi:anti-anti-sigma factor
MDLSLHSSPWDRVAEGNRGGTMLRFTDFVSPRHVENDLNFGQHLDAIIEAEAKGDVYLDFENVESLNAADIGKIVRAWRKLKAENRRLVLCNVEPFAYELLNITCMDTLMEIRRGGPHFSGDLIEIESMADRFTGAWRTS